MQLPSAQDDLSSMGSGQIDRLVMAAWQAVDKKLAALSSSQAKANALQTELRPLQSASDTAQKKAFGLSQVEPAWSSFAAWKSSHPACNNVLGLDISGLVTAALSGVEMKVETASQLHQEREHQHTFYISKACRAYRWMTGTPWFIQSICSQIHVPRPFSNNASCLPL